MTLSKLSYEQLKELLVRVIWKEMCEYQIDPLRVSRIADRLVEAIVSKWQDEA